MLPYIGNSVLSIISENKEYINIEGITVIQRKRICKIETYNVKKIGFNENFLMKAII